MLRPNAFKTQLSSACSPLHGCGRHVCAWQRVQHRGGPWSRQLQLVRVSSEKTSQTGPSASSIPPGFAALTQSFPASKPKFMECVICRLYYFSQTELEVVKELIKAMKACRTALVFLAGASILLTITQTGQHGEAEAQFSAAMITAGGLTIGDVAYWADSLMVAALISYAIGPFERVLQSRSNQMAYTFQGVNRLALIFQQLSIGSVAVSTVTGLEAAAKYPPLVVGTSLLFFGVAVIRSAAMWWTLTCHTINNEEVTRTLGALRDPEHSAYAQQMSWLDRAAVFLAFGYLLEYEAALKPAAEAPVTSASQGSVSTPTVRDAAMSATSSSSSSSTVAVGSTGDMAASILGCEHNPGDYQFNIKEERILRSLTEAASTAGLALGLQAFVTYMLTVADVGVNDIPDALSNGINASNKLLMCTLLYSATSKYDRALHSDDGNDVEHLMNGLGHKGLTGLFDSLAVLSWAVFIATLAGLVIPYIEEDVLARVVGDGVAHRSAEALVEALEYVRALLRSRV